MNNKIERSSSHIIARRVNFNQDIAYIIDNAGIKYGFAAEVIRIITYLAYAEYIGAYPVVDFRQDWTYRENKMISGTSIHGNIILSSQWINHLMILLMRLEYMESTPRTYLVKYYFVMGFIIHMQ